MKCIVKAEQRNSYLIRMQVLVLVVGFCCAVVFPQPILFPPVEVRTSTNILALVEDEDTDGDKKITIDDYPVPDSERGNKRFWLVATDNARYEVVGTYYLSNLLQELGLAKDAHRDTAVIDPSKVYENPVHRISRLIRELYWDSLTRRIDEEGLLHIVADTKTHSVDGYHYLYVPRADALALDYFSQVARRRPEQKLKIIRLPQQITSEFVKSLEGRHGLLSLALQEDGTPTPRGVPFVVPGGRFNEMYGWDSYFEALGLIRDGRIELAKAMVDNFVYEINYYGMILNANRTYYLTRSQPPFLTSMALAVYRELPATERSKQWLARVLEAAIKEYREVWMGDRRRTKTGLSRYFDMGSGVPPEVEPGHFDPVFARFAKKLGMDPRPLEDAYRSGTIHDPELDEYFVHDRAMRESGHDTSYRLEGVCADLVTVDLNSLLYKIERDIAETLDKEFGGRMVLKNGVEEIAARWYELAEHRKMRMNRFLWNDDEGMFFDYNVQTREQHKYVSATTLYPLWAGLATAHQAELLVQKALPLLEMAGGIVSSTKESRGELSPIRPPRQWDYPNGWPPHQILVWHGLLRYGYDSVAHRLIYRWLYTITRNAANYNGTIPEKFDVVNRSHDVFAEYGNIGTKFEYITREGFGWMNASYQIGLDLLPEFLKKELRALVPPERIFEG